MTPGLRALARVYIRARAMHHRISANDAAFTGLWLGAATRELLHAIDENCWGRLPPYQDDAHNLRGLMDWEEPPLERHFRERRRIAVIGAGGGREVVALARRGHAVDGFECNVRLVDYGRSLLAREALEGDLRHLPRDQAPTAEQPYDGIIIGWCAYMMIAGREHRIALLRALRTVLVPRGPLLLSYVTRADDEARAHRVARIANRIRRLLRRPPVEAGDDLVPSFAHRFTQAEVADELAAAGFLRVDFGERQPGRFGGSVWAVAESA
jgi:SAM-dependent methyltransferase